MSSILGVDHALGRTLIFSVSFHTAEWCPKSANMLRDALRKRMRVFSHAHTSIPPVDGDGAKSTISSLTNFREVPFHQTELSPSQKHSPVTFS